MFQMSTFSSSGLLIVFLGLAIFLLRQKTSRLRSLMGRLPQGPRPLPILGNALQLLPGGLDRIYKTIPYLSCLSSATITFKYKFNFPDVLQVIMVDWPSKYGEIFCSYIGHKWNVNISSPELMEVTNFHLHFVITFKLTFLIWWQVDYE